MLESLRMTDTATATTGGSSVLSSIFTFQSSDQPVLVIATIPAAWDYLGLGKVWRRMAPSFLW